MNGSSDTAGAGTECFGEAEVEPPHGLVLDVSVEDNSWDSLAGVEQVVAAAGGAVAVRMELENCEAAVALSSDARVRELNRTYRGRDKPTNVLSFPSPAVPFVAEGLSSTRYLGDIILAAETVAAEAAHEGKPVRHHVQHLVVHGLLHLLGHDHEAEDAARRMEKLEVEILDTLGVPDPYGEAA